MKYITKLIVFIQIALFITTVNAFSQGGIDNAGKDFYFAFMPNWHQNNPQDDFLYVFISSKFATKGKIEYTDKSGVSRTQSFSINVPNQVITLSFDPTQYELTSQNNSGSLLPDGGDDESIRKTTFHLTSDEDVTVVIHNEAVFTSDACLVYPVDALGNNYFVFSYESNYAYLQFSIQSTPSQFIIVGTEDNTKISIEPTAPTLKNGRIKQDIILNKGEVYLVQADVTNYKTTPPGGSDLTGTRIKSDKKVAVFGGHQRANIPYTEYSSRDYLLSQMIPLEAWGRDVFIVPFFQPISIDNPDYDITKITVAFDDTEISFAGKPYTTLNQGEKITLPIIDPIYVTGDKPIRACLYKKSTQTPGSQSGKQSSSDPFMVLFPPKAQFLRDYNFINVDLPQKYKEHYVNIIIPTISISSIRLDGNPINANFKPIEGIAYSYANYQVSAGTHKIIADTNFGICVYGYGQTNSYGYVGGLGLEVQDWNPPGYSFNSIDCFSTGFTFTEKNKDDSYIDSVVILEQKNLTLKILDSTKTEYNANLNLIDKYNDGIFRCFAIDSAGSKTKDTIIIEGFTLTMSDNNYYENVDFIDTVNYNSSNCIDVTITNYGLIPKDIRNLKLRDGTIISKTNTPQILLPGQSQNFQVCFQSNFTPGWYRDTLELSNDCFSEVMGTFGFYQRPDENMPAVVAEGIDCGDELLHATELYESDYGFGDYKKITSDNLDITLKSLNEKEIILKLHLQDPYKDGTYEFNFVDRAGNDTTITGIVQGFTASFVENKDNKAISFSTQNIGYSKCLDVLIENHGLLPIVLDKINFKDRNNFFIPQSQLPFTVMPNTTVPFTVCFEGDVPTEDSLIDELAMTFNCLSKKILVDGKPEKIIIAANSKCDYEMIITLDQVPNSLSIEKIYPNPTNDQLNMKLNVEKPRPISIDLVSTDGFRYNVLSNNIEKGSYNLRIDVHNLPSGSYVLQVNSEGKSLSNKVLINK
ncbi:T9SS type A sorting domain-containing protein [bacterium]|nr:MAG: T9SS type A sorting domain-containing protein [bacterium]